MRASASPTSWNPRKPQKCSGFPETVSLLANVKTDYGDLPQPTGRMNRGEKSALASYNPDAICRSKKLHS